MLDVLAIQGLEDRMLFVSKYHVCITPEVFSPTNDKGEEIIISRRKRAKARTMDMICNR